MTAGRRALVALMLTATAAFVVGVVLERHETHNEIAETPAQRAAESPAQRAAESPAQRAAESTTSGTTSEHSQSGPSSGETSEHDRSGESGQENGEHTGSGESSEGAGHDESGAKAQHSGSRQSGESTAPKANTETSATSRTAAASTPEPTSHAGESETLLGINPESTDLLVVAVVASLALAAGAWWLGGSALVLGIVALAMAAFAALDVREIVHQTNESRTGLTLLAALVAALHIAAALLAARAAVAARANAPPVAGGPAPRPIIRRRH
jgi:hypothetical protein